MPMQRERYPQAWETISRQIREAAGFCCEWCGKPQGEVRVTEWGDWYDEERRVWRSHATPHDQLDPIGCGGMELPNLVAVNWKLTRCVITVAHTSLCVGGDKHDKHDLTGLRALCNRCHLLHDLEDHKANAAKTRERKKRERFSAAVVEPLPLEAA